MHIGILIQARMSSSRLPGKILQPVHGKPLLQYVVERCKLSTAASLVAVLTSVEQSDDPVQQWCENFEVACYRGPLDDVAERFNGAVTRFRLDAFFRVCADSPFVDPALYDEAADIFLERPLDLVTNVQRRTFPVGLSVELISAKAFTRALALMSTRDEREHVTRYIYKHAGNFAIYNMESGIFLGDRALAVDTADDLERVTAIVHAMDRPHWEYGHKDICDLAVRLGLLEPQAR